MRQQLDQPPWPELIIQAAQAPLPSMAIIIRTTGPDANVIASAVRRTVNELDPDLPLGELLTVEDAVEMFYPRVKSGAPRFSPPPPSRPLHSYMG